VTSDKSDISEKIKAAINFGLVPLLRQEGFRRQEANFYKREEHVLTVVNVQSSQHNSATIPYFDEGRFTLNFGVHFPSVAKVLHGADPMPPLPKEHFCLLRRRVGMLMPGGGDHWWTVTSSTDAEGLGAELNSIRQMYVWPWLSKVRNGAGAAREMELNPGALSGNLATAAAAFIVLGQREKASELVEKQLEDLERQRERCHPSNQALLERYIAELKGWAADNQLGGLSSSGKTP